MKFFLDTNIPYSALEIFEELKLEAVHSRDAGLSKADDKEIMNYAVKNERILVTKDLGFSNTTIFPPESHHGLVVLRFPSFFKASQFVKSLKDFLISINVNDIEKAIVIVKLGRYRIRKL